MVIKQIINGKVCQMEPLWAVYKDNKVKYYFSEDFAVEKPCKIYTKTAFSVFFCGEEYFLPEVTSMEDFHKNRLKLIEFLKGDEA